MRYCCVTLLFTIVLDAQQAFHYNRPYGQSKPAYVDWDNDGDLDLLVGNNSNRVVYFENIGTRKNPKFAKAVKLVHDQGEHFSFRSRPAPVDYNKDGLIDLIAGLRRP